MLVYKNSTNSSLTRSFYGTPAAIRIKSKPTQTRFHAKFFCFVLSSYDNFGLIFKGPEDTATQSIENWKLSTTPLSIDPSLLENPSKQN